MNCRLLWVLPLGLLLTAAAAPPRGGDERTILTPEQYGELAKALKGREPGKPVRCLPTRGTAPSLTAISNELLLYRDGRRVYATRVMGKCNGLTSGGALVTRPTGGQLCRGDIARVADLSSPGGGVSGACAMGDFIPYLKGGRE